MELWELWVQQHLENCRFPTYWSNLTGSGSPGFDSLILLNKDARKSLRNNCFVIRNNLSSFSIHRLCWGSSAVLQSMRILVSLLYIRTRCSCTTTPIILLPCLYWLRLMGVEQHWEGHRLSISALEKQLPKYMLFTVIKITSLPPTGFFWMYVLQKSCRI